MIWFYSGTPGSGKSFHVAKDMFMKLHKKENVISTVDVNLNLINDNGKRKIGRFDYVPILELTPQYFYDYAGKYHVKGKEKQTLIIIDECQIIFNPRDYSRAGRSEWILFFTRHRHLGFNVILISQFDRLVDRQIRSLFEYEVKHRKVNNYGSLFFLPFTIFVTITYWYVVREVIAKEFFIFKKKYADIYDSYTMFDEFVSKGIIKCEKPEDTSLVELEMGVSGVPIESKAMVMSSGFKFKIKSLLNFISKFKFKN